MKRGIKALSFVMAAVMSVSAMQAITVSAKWYKTSDGQYYYTDADGDLCIGWRTINGNKYFFDDDGYMHTGWLTTEDGDKYYFRSSGKMAVDCTLKIGSTSYSFDDEGTPTVVVAKKASTGTKKTKATNTSSSKKTASDSKTETSSQTKVNSKDNKSSVSKSSTSSQSATVYITKTGKKYHYSSSCNGATYYPTTIDEAVDKGLKPCDKCVN